VAFASARQALDCAIAIQRSLADHRRASGFAPSVRIGLHVGDVVQPGASYEGRAVHLAARIGAEAGSDEILASLDVFEAAGQGYSHGTPREVTLRGLRDPVPVASLLVPSERSPAPGT
jgi:eukaryotic-like serine/threonine-protein kinase